MKPIPLKVLTKCIEKKNYSQGLVRGAAIDSRKVKYGDLFFALPGERVDGHDFLEQDSKKGAIGAVIKEDYQGDTFGLEINS